MKTVFNILAVAIAVAPNPCFAERGIDIVSIDKKEVFTRPYAPRPGDYDTWTYFWERTAKK
jgi:hypothetical protein